MTFGTPERTFLTPQAELAHLQGTFDTGPKTLTSAEDIVRAYHATPTGQVLSQEHVHIATPVPEMRAVDAGGYKEVMQGRGVKAVLELAQKSGNAQVEDDVFQMVVAEITAGRAVADMPPTTPLGRGLNRVLYEILMPNLADGEEARFKESLSLMEQLYATLLPHTRNAILKDYFTIELGVSAVHESLSMYISVPTHLKDIFEKQMAALFPRAQVKISEHDYNPFVGKGGTHEMSIASQTQVPIFSLRTYEAFDFDPLGPMIASFARLKKDGEGAAIQLMVTSSGDIYKDRFKRVEKRVEHGQSPKEAWKIINEGALAEMGEALVGVFIQEEKKEPNQQALTALREKMQSPLVGSSLRLVASAETRERADTILSTLEASFSQFRKGDGNGLQFKRLKGAGLRAATRDFSARVLRIPELMPLSLKEVTTMMHFAAVGKITSRELKQSQGKVVSAQMGISEEGILLGVSKSGTEEHQIRFADRDRLRHFYVIGQTGTGKTTLLVNMIIQDIQRGDGVCFIDPHGSDIMTVLANIPQSRFKDVIYFDPANLAMPMGLNMLEYDQRFPEQKTFVVNELLAIFDKLFDLKQTGGPMFEQYFRNATQLVLEDPSSGMTLLDISRVLSNEDYRRLKLARSSNPLLRQFWTEIAGKAGGEASLANIVPYITSKFDGFIANDYMRPIITQEQSAFNFREVMDSKKILLVNLAKGRLGDINAHLLGLILVGKILMAALSRVDALGEDLPPFYLYIDEFQNVTTPSIATILSEARKYKLSLTIAHQFVSQLPEDIRGAVFGNVGSMAAFRVGIDDAEALKGQFSPQFDPKDIAEMANYTCALRMLVEGKPFPPFTLFANNVPAGNKEQIEALKQLSAVTYGRPRAEIDAELAKRFA